MALRLNTSEKNEIIDIRRLCFAFWELGTPIVSFVRCFIRTLLVALSPRLYCEAAPVAPERHMEFGGLARALKAAKLRNFLVQFPVFSRAQALGAR